MTGYKVVYEYKPKPIDIEDTQGDPWFYPPFKGETIVWAENIAEAFDKTIRYIHANNQARILRNTTRAIVEKTQYPTNREIVISKLQLEVTYQNVIV